MESKYILNNNNKKKLLIVDNLLRSEKIKTIPLDDSKAQLRKRLLFLALPVILENLLQVTFHFTDMIFVGRLSPISLAGVGLTQ